MRLKRVIFPLLSHYTIKSSIRWLLAGGRSPESLKFLVRKYTVATKNLLTVGDIVCKETSK